MQNKYTLVVVDMQYGFATSKGALPGCIREVKKAVKDNAPIIFLEFKGGFHGNTFGDTLQELKDIVKDYGAAHFASKCTDDGSNEVCDLVKTLDLPKKYMRVCGVNTDACVQSTVAGLSIKFDNLYIDVIADACNSNHDHINGLKHMSMIGKTTKWPNWIDGVISNNTKVNIINWKV